MRKRQVNRGSPRGAGYQGGLPFSSVTGSAILVPEASTWAMLLLGFAGLGYAGYRRSAGRAPPLEAA